MPKAHVRLSWMCATLEEGDRSMSGYGLFQAATLGMQSQAQRLNTIGYNIANVNTGGFKRTDTEFETLLSDTAFQQSDLGGVKPYARSTNDVQGLITPTQRPLDLAITGDGFFAVQPELSGTTEIFFTRDGSFNVNTVDGQTSSVTSDDGATITVANGYLVDKNGYFLLGSAVNADGSFSSSAAAPMRVDQYAFTDIGQATTAAAFEFNLPANNEFGATADTFALRSYDSNSAERNISFDFSPTQTENQWRINARADNLTLSALGPSTTATTSTTNAGIVATDTQFVFDTATNTVQLSNTATGAAVNNAFSSYISGDQITFAGAANAGNNATFTISNVTNNGSTLVLDGPLVGESTAALPVTGTSAAALTNPLIFSSLGQLTTPTSMDFSATWSDGATSTFTIDTSAMTQFNGEFTIFRSSQDGLAQANITDVSFDNNGQVLGTFSDGTQRAIYKVPLYDFVNPNGLESANGMIFKETADSGSATAFFGDESARASFISGAIEISNVDIAAEFARMIQTQAAYNMSATSFKTIDEMTTVARDLKA